MYEMMHLEGEEIPHEEYAIASLEREICAAENRLLEILSRCEKSRKDVADYESKERSELSRIEILTETVERLKEEL